MPFKSPEKRKEYNNKYREEHIDYYKEYNKKYYIEHKDHIKSESKKYRNEHKDSIKEYKRKYQKDNKEQINRNWRRSKDKTRIKVIEYARNKFWDEQWIIRCYKCWCNVTWIMHWHHLNPSKKIYNISQLQNFDKVKNEIENNWCVPLCATCHLIEHYTNKKISAIYKIYKDNLDILPPVLKEKIQCRAMNNLNNLITKPDELSETDEE